MIILIEGPDGAGKTYLANELSKRKLFYYLHLNKSDDVEETYRILIGQLYQLKQTGVNVVIDRATVSNYVYSKVFGGDVLSTRRRILFEELIDYVIVCLPKNKNKYLKDFEQLKLERVEDYNTMEEVYDLFEEQIKENNYNRYDRYENHNFDIILHDLMKNKTLKFVKTSNIVDEIDLENYPLLNDNHKNHKERYFDNNGQYYKVVDSFLQEIIGVIRLKDNYKRENSKHLDFIEINNNLLHQHYGSKIINILEEKFKLEKVDYFTLTPIDIVEEGPLTKEFYIKKLGFEITYGLTPFSKVQSKWCEKKLN